MLCFVNKALERRFYALVSQQMHTPFVADSHKKMTNVFTTAAHGQLCRSYKLSPIPCQTDLRITNHRGHKFTPSLTLLSLKVRIEWPSVLTVTANFSSVLFQLQQYSRQHPRFSAHRAALNMVFIFSSIFLKFCNSILLSL